MADGPREGYSRVRLEATLGLFCVREADALLSRGKTLGGSSSINDAVWTRGVKEQYDSWSELLEEDEASLGWNWDGLFSYMKKVRSCQRSREICFVVSKTALRLKGSHRRMLSNAQRAPTLSRRTTVATARCKLHFLTGCTGVLRTLGS